MKKIALFCLLITLSLGLEAQNPKHELRAVWITTHFGLDWPVAADATATKKSKLTAMLDNLKTLGINTIYFQVRSIGDALYPSAIVPWSNRMTGTYGQDPLWDPLAFAIQECHNRGMELHAWLNPYRAATDASNINSYTANHKAKTNPEWLLEQVSGSTTLKYFNPALSAVRNHIDDVVRELVNNYDLDGIHFDDYFYYSGLGTQDQSNFSSDPRGFANINDWRRDNVTLLIQQLSNSIKSLKPWVKFGISPSGIYKNFTVPGSSPSITTTGSQHYSTQYADTKKWMEDGLIDYLVPQVYWAFSQVTANAKFNYITDYWNALNFNRHLFIGLGTYRTNDGTGSAFSTDEIKNQLNYLRNNCPNIKGAAHFRAAQTVTTLPASKSTMEYIRDNQYSTLAIIPPMTWIDPISPNAPTGLNSSLVGGKTKLTWDSAPSETDELQKVVRYTVYRSTSPNINFNDASQLIAILPASQTNYLDNEVNPGAGNSYYYAIRALDRMSNESTESNVAPDGLTLPINLIQFNAKANNQHIQVVWESAQEEKLSHYIIEKSTNQFDWTLLSNQKAQLQAGINRYFALDKAPTKGTNYYRLSAVDIDGKISKQSIVSTLFGLASAGNVLVAPNPTNTTALLHINNLAGHLLSLSLYNTTGKLYSEIAYQAKTNNDNFAVANFGNLPSGIYLLRVKSNQGFYQQIKLLAN